AVIFMSAGAPAAMGSALGMALVVGGNGVGDATKGRVVGASAAEDSTAAAGISTGVTGVACQGTERGAAGRGSRSVRGRDDAQLPIGFESRIGGDRQRLKRRGDYQDRQQGRRRGASHGRDSSTKRRRWDQN